MIWEFTISYHSIDNGKGKVKKEKYVFDKCESFGEVEQKAIDLFDHLSEMEVVAIKQSKVKEIVNYKKYQDEKIFDATLRDVFVDEDGNEKYINYHILLCAKTFDNAKDLVSQYLKQGYDLTLVTLKETSFVDILV